MATLNSAGSTTGWAMVPGPNGPGMGDAALKAARPNAPSPQIGAHYKVGEQEGVRKAWFGSGPVSAKRRRNHRNNRRPLSVLTASEASEYKAANALSPVPWPHVHGISRWPLEAASLEKRRSIRQRTVPQSWPVPEPLNSPEEHPRRTQGLGDRIFDGMDDAAFSCPIPQPLGCGMDDARSRLARPTALHNGGI